MPMPVIPGLSSGMAGMMEQMNPRPDLGLGPMSMDPQQITGYAPGPQGPPMGGQPPMGGHPPMPPQAPPMGGQPAMQQDPGQMLFDQLGGQGSEAARAAVGQYSNMVATGADPMAAYQAVAQQFGIPQ